MIWVIWNSSIAVYERLMYNQIYPYFDTLFSTFLYGFWKGFNYQHCLLAVIEKSSKTLDKGGETGAVLGKITLRYLTVLITTY